MTSPNRNILITFVLLTLLFSSTICFLDYPPLTDYPSHLLSINIIKEYNNPDFNYREFFTVNWRPLPNLLSNVIILLLSLVFPITIAGKLYLFIVAGLFSFSIYYFLSAVDKNKSFLCLFAFLFLYNWYFYRGYLNFWGSLPVFFFAFGYWISSAKLGGIREKLIMGLLITVLYFSHFFSWIALGISIAVLSLFDFKNRAKLLNSLLAFAPSVLLAMIYFLNLGGGSSVSRGAVFESPINNLIYLALYTFAKFSKMDLLLYAAPLALAGFLVIKSHICRGGAKNALEKRLFYLGVLLAILIFILPLQLSSVWPFNIRMNLFVIFIFIASISTERAVQFKKIITITVTVFAVIIWGYSTVKNFQMSRRIENYTSGIDHVRQNSSILPLTVDISGGWATLSPMSTAWAYYHIFKGGAGPYLFNLPHGQIVNYKTPKNEMFPAPSLYPHRVQDFDINAHSDPYDYVILWGNDERIEEQLYLKFRLEYTNGDLKIYEKIESD